MRRWEQPRGPESVSPSDGTSTTSLGGMARRMATALPKLDANNPFGGRDCGPGRGGRPRIAGCDGMLNIPEPGHLA